MTFEVMLAKPYDAKRIAGLNNVVIQPKVDGIRVVVLTSRSGPAQFFSRNGRGLHMFTHMSPVFQKVAQSLHKTFPLSGYDLGAMFDGEMCAATFGDIAGAIHRKGYIAEDAFYCAFHAMPLKYFKDGKDDSSQDLRYTQLGRVLRVLDPDGIKLLESVIITEHSEVHSMYKNFRNRGHEGAIVKNMDAPWEAKRSPHWLKLKEAITFDLKVVGFKPGNGKYKGTLGAIIVDHKGVHVPVSGMDDELRDKIWKARKKFEGTLAEIEAQEVTVHGSLRHPRFIRFRDDKARKPK